MFFFSIGFFFCFLGFIGVLNAMVVQPGENFVETASNLMKIFQGQFALFQLTVGKDGVDEILDPALDTC